MQLAIYSLSSYKQFSQAPGIKKHLSNRKPRGDFKIHSKDNTMGLHKNKLSLILWARLETLHLTQLSASASLLFLSPL